MAAQQTSLGDELNAFASGVLDLLLATEDVKQAKRLRSLLEKAHTRIAQLVEGNVKEATAEYQAATAGVEKANQAIDKATNDLSKTADAIDKIAKAVDLLAKLAKAIGVA